MKLSEMTMYHLAVWCHVQPDDERLQTAWVAAKNAILSAIGLTEVDADQYDNLTFAAIALSADMLYNPGVHIDNDKINNVVGSFIFLHDHNLLPGEVTNV